MIVNFQGGLGNQMFQYAYARSKCPTPYFNISRLAAGNPPRKLELGAWADIAITEEQGEEGYWQDERLFNEALMRWTFRRPREKASLETLKTAAKIYKQPSAFIGVRRSDYLWPDKLKFHGVMPAEYYKEALKCLPPAKLFIFTDDQEWAKENLDGEIIGSGDHWDIWLMSLCTHAIIANSTFHWWGAWLGPDRKGKVIAPSKWFADGTPWPIVPDRWTKI